MTTKLEQFKEERPHDYYDKVKDPLDTGLSPLYPSTWIMKLLQTLGVAPDWNEEDKLKALLDAENEAKAEWFKELNPPTHDRGLKGNRDSQGNLISK
jgi:hypothetical protein